MRTISIAAMALLAASSLALAAELTPDEEQYVGLAGTSIVLGIMCKTPPVENGLGRYGDKIGVDVDRLQSNIMAALAANFNRPYDRAELNPAVTKRLLYAMNGVSQDIEKNKLKNCAFWGKPLREKGIIE